MKFTAPFFSLLFTLPLMYARAGDTPVQSQDFRLQGPGGREIILHVDGHWEFAAPLTAFKVSVGERTLQILDARATTVRHPFRPTAAPEKSETNLSTILQVQFREESSRTPTEYDVPESLLRVEAIALTSGEILATSTNTHLGSGASGFVWPELSPGTYSGVNSVKLERPQGWPQKVGLRFVYKKSYTPPPNETTFEFKEVPVFQ